MLGKSIRVGIATFVAGVCLLGLGCHKASLPPEKSSASTLAEAVRQNEIGHAENAVALVRQLLVENPDDKHALAFAIELHAGRNELLVAAELATRLAEIDPSNAAANHVRAFYLYLRAGRFEDAQRCLETTISVDGENVDAIRLLAQLHTAQGRRVASSRLVERLIRLQQANQIELLSLIDLTGPFDLVTYGNLVDLNRTSLFQLGQIRKSLTLRKDPAEIIKVLESLLSEYPNDPTVSAMYGWVVVENSQDEAINRWLSNLPQHIEQEPEYWHALGTWLASSGRHREAIRAFGECIRHNPTAREALRSMVSSLGKLERDDLARHIREQLAVLDRIIRLARDADAEEAKWISDRLMDLVRPWESLGWLKRTRDLQGTTPEATVELNARRAQILAWEAQGTPESIAAARLERTLGFDLNEWPLPKTPVPILKKDSDIAEHPQSQIRFTDVAPAIGVSATYVSGFNGEGTSHPYQINGGGLAALDYDLDGRCDIYIVQSGGKPNEPNGSHKNQLFRQVSAQLYTEVTIFAGADDQGYGQGVCAGDINQDGFPDLLVANIGLNQIYINQGDGTYLRSEHLVPDAASQWTSSVAIADLSGDHSPELIEVNYIDDPLALTAVCINDSFLCQPQRFKRAADIVYKGAIDGTFKQWDRFADRNHSPQLGFALVVANYDRLYGNDFFVANDGDYNHFWASEPNEDDSAQRFQLVESALVRGCSVGRGGYSQACMGIAFGDFDRNSTLDLHITNFYNEPANLFLQNRSGFFSDEAHQYELTGPSYGVLGFGTQAADFDNDGWLDLYVLNGHVYQATDPTVPFRMLPQLFSGRPEGFQLEEPTASGEYGERKRLGRTLAQLDWNHDGKMDLLSSHLDTPVSLLENRSPPQNWIQLELVGTTSERDAIGASVTISAAGESWTGWQIGGDGYMCSNEPVIHVGLHRHSRIDRMEVVWPSGITQEFHNIDANRRILIIEAMEGYWNRN